MGDGACMAEFPGKGEFASAVGSEFTMELEEGGELPILLKACEMRTDTPLQECFSLVFLAPPDAPPTQMMRRLRHAALGEMNIFLVPFKRDDAGLRYEAVFNRLRT